jgi:hypothetical protein
MEQLVHAMRAGLALCLLLAAGGALAQAGPVEQQLKAAYLYKFAWFVEWPEGAVARGATLVIGAAGDEPLDGVHILFGALVPDELSALLASASSVPGAAP